MRNPAETRRIRALRPVPPPKPATPPKLELLRRLQDRERRRAARGQP